MNDKNDDEVNIINKNEDIGKNLDKTLEKIDQNNFHQLGETPNKIKERENEEVRKEEDKKTIKKDDKISLKIDENKIEKYKGNYLVELLEIKLTNILLEQKTLIDSNEMNELKKISCAIIIKGKDALEIINKFFEQNFNKVLSEMDRNLKVEIGNKKIQIFSGLQEIVVIYYNKEIKL